MGVLNPIESEETKAQIDHRVETSDDYKKLRPYFDHLTKDIDNHDVEYYTGRNTVETRIHTAKADGVVVRLNCHLSLDQPETDPTCQVTIETEWS